MKKLIIGLFIFSLFIIGSNVKAATFSANNTSDLHLTQSDNNKTFEVAKQQIVTVTLCNPGDGGYQFDTPKYDNSVLILISHVNIPTKNSPPGIVGGCYGDDVFKFQAINLGTTKLEITASRGWSGGGSVSMFNSILNITSSSNNPVISGVSGSQNLNVNQVGTWGIIASNPTGGNLSYSVVWGDEPFYQTSSTSTIPTVNGYQQSATFTHSYSRTGTFTPVFTVINENTIRCFTTPCPSNAGSAQTSLSVKVGDSIPIDIQGCLPGFEFSTMTGLPCSTEFVNDGCLAGYNFSPITGQVCNTQYKNTCTEPGSNCGIINYRISRTLRRGTQGDDVKRLQTFLGIKVDGSYGKGTAAKVKEWQVINGLKADGAFGMKSAKKAGLTN
jgi:peptidoglycan hydrolase-like protein with peptidoglycan-binding domain